MGKGSGTENLSTRRRERSVSLELRIQFELGTKEISQGGLAAKKRVDMLHLHVIPLSPTADRRQEPTGETHVDASQVLSAGIAAAAAADAAHFVSMIAQGARDT